MSRVAAAAFAVLVACGSGIASASAGGSGAGSVGAPGTPKPRDTICLTGCSGLRKAVVGSTVQVSGSDMAAVKAITFRGRQPHKRVLAPVTTTTNTSAQAVVPSGVRSGAVRVRDAYGQKSEPGKAPLLVLPKRNLRSSGPPHLLDAQVSPNKVFYGTRSATLSYVVGSGQPANDLRVDVVTSAGQVVQSFPPTSVAPNTTQSIAWNGSGFDGKPVADGWYSFRLSAPDGLPLGRATASDTPNLGVAVFAFIFPVRGPHNFGGPEGRFGAARDGHTHQGQDVMADCGTKLVAARGGTVQYAGYQGAAGNYIVIDQKGSGEDNAYMHLAAPSPLATGDRVRTGQYIGDVGDTGDARGCHLHFEVWSAPGWYEGGQPYDPLPLLKAWDKYS
ncbi:MAG TPA: peptidoglycan DD-metalloendopeptidase family protein [Solirubrobacterales bacterium]